MSLQLGGEPARPPHGRERRRTLVAVWSGFVLTALPPFMIAAVLRQLSRGARASTRHEAERARSAVCFTSERCAGQGCLQRSIATFWLCRMYGHTPGWRTGYRLEPFAAHAWVDVDGSPVQESPEVEHYVAVISVPQPREEMVPPWPAM